MLWLVAGVGVYIYTYTISEIDGNTEEANGNFLKRNVIIIKGSVKEKERIIIIHKHNNLRSMHKTYVYLHII
jgi:hypothetical protein